VTLVIKNVKEERGPTIAMRVSKQKAARNREQILLAAARLFRERGIEGTGVDSITGAAGLTHGGLYSHFGSKRAILVESIRFALAKSRRRWESSIENGPAPRALHKIVNNYLSEAHRDRPGGGCLAAALSSDIARQSAAVRRAFTVEIERVFDLLSALMPGRTNSIRRAAATAAFACMMGALIIARAVDNADLSNAIMRDAARCIADGAMTGGARQGRERRVHRGTEKRNGGRNRSRGLHRRSDRKKVRG